MKTFCLLNHPLTENQIKELDEKYGIDDIVYPSNELSENWAQVTIEPEIDMNLVNNVRKWMKEYEKGDLLIIQGESGHTFTIVDWALTNGLTVLHAVSRRVEREDVQGEVIVKSYIFKHECFREYRRYMNRIMEENNE